MYCSYIGKCPCLEEVHTIFGGDGSLGQQLTLKSLKRKKLFVLEKLLFLKLFHKFVNIYSIHDFMPMIVEKKKAKLCHIFSQQFILVSLLKEAHHFQIYVIMKEISDFFFLAQQLKYSSSLNIQKWARF